MKLPNWIQLEIEAYRSSSEARNAWQWLFAVVLASLIAGYLSYVIYR